MGAVEPKKSNKLRTEERSLTVEILACNRGMEMDPALKIIIVGSRSSGLMPVTVEVVSNRVGEALATAQFAGLGQFLLQGAVR